MALSFTWRDGRPAAFAIYLSILAICWGNRFCTRSYILLIFWKKNKKIVKYFWKICKNLETNIYRLLTFVQSFEMKWHFIWCVQKRQNQWSKWDLDLLFENTDFVFFTHTTENVISFRNFARMWTTLILSFLHRPQKMSFHFETLHECEQPIYDCLLFFLDFFIMIYYFFIFFRNYQEHVSSGAIVNFRN